MLIPTQQRIFVGSPSEVQHPAHHQEDLSPCENPPGAPRGGRPLASVLTAAELGLQPPANKWPRARTKHERLPVLLAAMSYAEVAKAVAHGNPVALTSAVVDWVGTVRSESELSKAWDLLPRPLASTQEDVARSLDKLLAADPLDPPRFMCLASLAGFARDPQALLAVCYLLTANVANRTPALKNDTRRLEAFQALLSARIGTQSQK